MYSLHSNNTSNLIFISFISFGNSFGQFQAEASLRNVYIQETNCPISFIWCLSKLLCILLVSPNKYIQYDFIASRYFDAKSHWFWSSKACLLPCSHFCYFGSGVILHVLKYQRYNQLICCKHFVVYFKKS